MGKRGPKRTDDTIRQLRGSRPRPKEPQGNYIPGRPGIPDWLPEEAHIFYQTTCELLHARGVLTLQDCHVLAALAMCQTDLRAIEQKISSEGLTMTGSHGGRVAHPLLPERSRLRSLEVRLLGELALTPATRESVKNLAPVVNDTINRFSNATPIMRDLLAGHLAAVARGER